MWVLPGYPFTLVLMPIAIAAGVYCISKFSKWNPSNLKIAVTNFIVMYLLIIFSAHAYEIYLEYKILTFDLDGDGFFSNKESTAEYAKYSSRLIGDVGRTFAPITGFVFSLFCSTCLFFILKLIDIFKIKGKR